MLAESIDPATKTQSGPPKLPSRDWIVLPLLSLLTVLLFLGTAEVLARQFWPAQEEDTCFGQGRFRAYCTATVKIPEGQWATDTYNDCGYRSALSCRSKSAGTFRVALLGSSAAHGLYLPFNQTFAAQAQSEMSQTSGRTVDIQNLGIPGTTPPQWYGRIDEVLALQPNAVVFTITPFDVEQIGLADEQTTPSQPSLYRRLQQILVGSRAALVAQHFLFSDRERFLRFYLLYGDKADFLRQPLSQQWRGRYAQLDEVIGKTEDRLRTANVPFYVLAVPSRAEAASLTDGQHPNNIDGLSFRDQIAAIAERHHAALIDAVAAFTHAPDADKLFYVVDGHVKPSGQQLIAHSLAESLRVQ